MNKLFYCIFTAALSLTLYSCEKVIDVNLNDSDTRLVVEGDITDEAGPYKVKLSRTVNFNESNNMPPVYGALVIISDSTIGHSDTLSQLAGGEYITHSIAGISGHTYQLSINVDDKWFHSSATMPEPIPYDSLYNDDLNIFGIRVVQLIPVFNDPINVKNYYRFIVQINDSVKNDIYAWDDDLSDGKTNSRSISIGDEDLFHGNDTATVTMHCIEKGLFDYYHSFENANGNASTPANPKSNISNGAFGRFGVYTVRRRTMIVP
jgi:hypothetical protein